MRSPLLPRRIPLSPAIGEKSAFSRTLTEADVALFIGVTWDVNPYHTDDTFVRATPIRQRIVPGLLTASLLTHMGGLWAFLAESMQLQFLAPVYIGDTITAESEVVEADPARGWVRLRSRCTNQNGKEVLRGDITGYPGRFETASSTQESSAQSG